MQATRAVLEHYALFDEDSRLTGAFGQFESCRVRELIARHLPAAAKILDLGGGTGAYSFWLASLSHEVHLVDLVPRHLEIAASRQAEAASPLASLTVGDARELPFPDGAVDLVILAGPLYHLAEPAERSRVLREVHRVLRDDGLLLAVAINRYAGVVYGLTQGLVFDSPYFDMITRELASGVRTNPPAGLKTFREGFFHHPTDLVRELLEAGFRCGPCLGVLGPAWQVPDLQGAWESLEKRERLLALARQLEHECILSPQLFCAAKKKPATRAR